MLKPVGFQSAGRIVGPCWRKMPGSRTRTLLDPDRHEASLCQAQPRRSIRRDVGGHDAHPRRPRPLFVAEALGAAGPPMPPGRSPSRINGSTLSNKLKKRQSALAPACCWHWRRRVRFGACRRSRQNSSLSPAARAAARFVADSPQEGRIRTSGSPNPSKNTRDSAIPGEVVRGVLSRILSQQEQQKIHSHSCSSPVPYHSARPGKLKRRPAREPLPPTRHYGRGEQQLRGDGAVRVRFPRTKKGCPRSSNSIKAPGNRCGGRVHPGQRGTDRSSILADDFQADALTKRPGQPPPGLLCLLRSHLSGATGTGEGTFTSPPPKSLLRLRALRCVWIVPKQVRKLRVYAPSFTLRTGTCSVPIKRKWLESCQFGRIPAILRNGRKGLQAPYVFGSSSPLALGFLA